MSKKELRKQLLEEHLYRAINGMYDVEYRVRKPWVCAIVKTAQGIEYLGFAKVKWPDVWDEDTGCQIALMKALGDLVRDQMQVTDKQNMSVGYTVVQEVMA